jgi:hypothetical protein
MPTAGKQKRSRTTSEAAMLEKVEVTAHLQAHQAASQIAKIMLNNWQRNNGHTSKK